MSDRIHPEKGSQTEIPASEEAGLWRRLLGLIGLSRKNAKATLEHATSELQWMENLRWIGDGKEITWNAELFTNENNRNEAKNREIVMKIASRSDEKGKPIVGLTFKQGKDTVLDISMSSQEAKPILEKLDQTRQALEQGTGYYNNYEQLLKKHDAAGLREEMRELQRTIRRIRQDMDDLRKSRTGSVEKADEKARQIQELQKQLGEPMEELRALQSEHDELENQIAKICPPQEAKIYVDYEQCALNLLRRMQGIEGNPSLLKRELQKWSIEDFKGLSEKLPEEHQASSPTTA